MNKIKVTFFGTTTLLFDDGIDQIMFDAHVTRPRVTKYIFGRIASDVNLVKEIIETEKIDRLKGIFISHSHYDHVLDAPTIANLCKAPIYGSESTINVGRGGNVPEEQLFLFDKFQQYVIGNFNITVLPALHSAPRFYNNNLGKTIEKPLKQPTKGMNFVEGGSYDFLVQYKEKSFLVHPSFNYIENAFNDIKADVVFLGIAGLGKASKTKRDIFFKETIEKLKAKTIIPIHWDKFYIPLKKTEEDMECDALDMRYLEEYCQEKDLFFIKQAPLNQIIIEV